MQIGNIVNGHVNELLGLNKNISEIRLAICRKCPLFSPRLGGMCNNRLWYNKETGDVSMSQKTGYVKGCGCALKYKTKNSNEKCPAGKW